MKLEFSIATFAVLFGGVQQVAAFSPSTILQNKYAAQSSIRHVSTMAAVETEGSVDEMDYATINSLTFRQLQKNCKMMGLAAKGNTAALRTRLLEEFGLATASVECADEDDECDTDDAISFVNEGDPDFDFNVLVSEIDEKCSFGHWKAATRKLKKLNKRYATDEKPVPRETYIAVLEACLENRLQGARASEPARKILEQMSEHNYDIPSNLGNQCIANCMGTGINGRHDDFGGIDTALAMLAAMEGSPSGSQMISVDSYGAIVSSLSADGAVEEACLLLRAMVVEHSFTPPLGTFADVARAAAKSKDMSETVIQVLTLAKAAGYVLDSIASAEAGRDLLASGVIAAEQMDSIPLGLRLLTAASKAEGCAPDRGDDLVASSSSAAQRACTLIHRNAIDQAVNDDNWKLAVKLLQLMTERSLTPATSVMRKVVSVCTKMEKSRKATALLLDWVTRAEEGKAEKPPLPIFNNVVNTCEICGEEDLTLVVLEALKKVHETEGNIVTTNIALKRLAKQGNLIAVEGLIIGMLQAGVEPNVVSYTTAIGGCVKAEDSAMAYEWMKRMRSRNVLPNYHTYNTALAACLDGKFESTARASTIATEMIGDVGREIAEGLKGTVEYNSVVPDKYTKVLARSLMKQLRENWRADDINIQVAKSTLRVSLLQLVDFEKTDAASEAKRRKEETCVADGDEECVDDVISRVVSMTKEHRRMEV
uniref:SAP domain-containing protein n=1 Tax=Chaetoceros debilis TaxID=122233 RepID=A0A7S3VEK2_9STRA|mmetsp:Transcript_19804/g.29160  ORF Transcript_19804/g.29160 Transcript_19804/m.29160 type:complete len:710 (-) Transcript_19804:290-2419(-)|eukprot:CAMPEP_0194089152 /NCGR_PEP_ID=MMETSP0149-20130528/32963_1 /TAXON_ID=122233 /ORGANISM="Chaetoceros debilis, Strain MM31A-1" /LENGTH=709 /DNA_ID=CAMNT_0038772985 /DNA_START=138 /DNA_END=2267 /DNA_ORIENTATION=+